MQASDEFLRDTSLHLVNVHRKIFGQLVTPLLSWMELFR
jgi:hypothetical protein